MAKKRKNKATRPEAAVDYYKLKKQAVDDLVTADASNSPPVSKEELERYGGRKKGGIPDPIKVAFVKFWFPASVCYFMIWGLGLADPLDQIVIVGIVHGMITDLLTNNMVRFIAAVDGANDRWLMFSKKRYASFLFNILYALLLSAVVVFLYAGVNIAINMATGTSGHEYLGLEPVGYGLFYMLSDMALVTVRNTIAKLFAHGKNKNVEEG